MLFLNFYLIINRTLGLAANFPDSFPISPRQPIRKKTSKVADESGIVLENKEVESNSVANPVSLESNDCGMVNSPPRLEKQPRHSRFNIDRAKPRKSPSRPLPG